MQFLPLACWEVIRVLCSDKDSGSGERDARGQLGGHKPRYELRCARCGCAFPGEKGVYKCSNCGARLEAVFSYETWKSLLRDALFRKAPRGMWRYKELLPVELNISDTGGSVRRPGADSAAGDERRAFAGCSRGRVLEDVITIGEGDTPLVSARNLAKHVGIDDLLIKYEGANPTGTFKDRCMSVAVTKVLYLGGKGVVLGSAGNAGSSAAAYSAKAGLACYVFVPATTPSERVIQTIMYGGKVILVKGTVNDCIDLIASIQDRYGWHNVTTAGCYNPYQTEGPKTIGYEIARDMGWQVPDWIFAPVGGGGLLASIWKAYGELCDLGVVKGLPKMVGVQAAGCAPLVRAFQKAADPRDIETWGEPCTIAAAIGDPYPLDGEMALKAIYSSGGCAVNVSHEEIIRSQRLLAEREGIFAEPASSTTIAALVRLVQEGRISKGTRVVCLASGTGLKDVRLAGQGLKAPPAIDRKGKGLEEALKVYQDE